MRAWLCGGGVHSPSYTYSRYVSMRARQPVDRVTCWLHAPPDGYGARTGKSLAQCVCTCMYRFVRVHVLERCISRRRWRQSFTIASARSEVIGNEEPPIDFTSLGPKFDWDSRFCARSPPASLFLISLRRLCRFFLFFCRARRERERERESRRMIHVNADRRSARARARIGPELYILFSRGRKRERLVVRVPFLGGRWTEDLRYYMAKEYGFFGGVFSWDLKWRVRQNFVECAGEIAIDRWRF